MSYLGGSLFPSLSDIFTASLTQAAATRSFNTNFIPNAVGWSDVSYVVRITGTASITLTGTSQVAGTVNLLAAASGTPAAPADLFDSTRNNVAFSGTVVVGVAITVTNAPDIAVRGYIPPGWTVRLGTVNDVGSPTIAYIAGREVKYT